MRRDEDRRRFTGDFLMTYDAAEEVMRLAERYGFACRTIPMKNTHHAQMRELLVSRDLDWVTQASEAHPDSADA